MTTTDHVIADRIPEFDRVLCFQDCDRPALTRLLACFGLRLKFVEKGKSIPGSFWGGAEAGLIDNRVLVRKDTPVHSVLHEACHFICMDPDRRIGLHTDAGGDYDEENAVCYLQIVLAGCLSGMGRERMFSDMDLWGYTFRLGSARSWFINDATDARAWLLGEKLLTTDDEPTGRLRNQGTLKFRDFQKSR
jgi:hypothetical protein